MRRCVLWILVLLPSFIIWLAPVTPGATSDTNQQVPSPDASSSEEKCSVSEAALKAINAAKSANPNYGISRELIRQAEAATRFPICNSARAEILADRAKRLAEEYLVSLRAEQEAREIRKKWASLLFRIFGIFWVLTISYAIYLGYRCVVSEDEKRAAKDSDKLAVVSLILLWACVPVSFFCWYYMGYYGSQGTWFLPFSFDIAAAVEVGFLFAGIPLVTALVASKKAIIRKDLAASVRRKSYVCFAIGLFIVCFLISGIFITKITSV